MRPLAVALGLFWLVSSGYAGDEAGQGPEQPSLLSFVVTRAGSEIEIDGRLVEKSWESATVIDLPYEWFPGENVEPPVSTDCRVTYDERHLYVGFMAYDPEPERIRAHLMDRDQIETLVQDDYVGFMIDTFNDQRRAYQFRINPLGVQAEAFNTASSEDWGWDMIWDSAGLITDEGYTVEIAVPFHQLRFPESKGALTFGFAAMRSWPRNVLHRIQSFYLDYSDSCWMCQFNRIVGFQGLSSGRNLEIDPTLTSSRTDHRGQRHGDLETGEVDVEPGLTARWGITPSLTLNGTGYPDFSQVEADVAQLEVNERFALFFPEKRPFFLEGDDFFQTLKRAVFTRTVADPAWGSKLTGKIGANALGAFVTRDRINNLVMPSNQFSILDSVEQDVTGTVLRYRRDVGRSSTFGALYTGREAADYYNRVVGIDGSVQIASADTLEFQVLRSGTKYPHELARRHDQSTEAFDGRGLIVQYYHDTRHWAWSASYEDLSPGFRADSGFIPRVDVRTTLVWISRTWWGNAGGWWTSFYLGPGFSRTVDHGGRLTNQSVGLEGQFQGPLQSRLLFQVLADKEYFNGVTFDLNRASFDFEMQPSGAMKLKLDGELGDGIDSFTTRKGDVLRLRPGVELKVGNHVNLNLSHSYQRLDVEPGRLFHENLTEARVFYYFDVRKLIRLIIQYRDIERDPSLFLTSVSPRDQHLFLQLLASYKLNPRTVVFLGYSDNHRGDQDLSLALTDRTFFIKLGYAWTL